MEACINNLENSIEKLEKELAEVERGIWQSKEWQSHPMGMKVMKWELERQRRELVVLKFLQEMGGPVVLNYDFPIPDFKEVGHGPIEIDDEGSSIDQLKNCLTKDDLKAIGIY